MSADTFAPSFAPAWATPAVESTPSWAQSAEPGIIVPLADLLASVAADDEPAAHPAGRVVTDSELSSMLSTARAEGATAARTAMDSAILAALAALPNAIEQATTTANAELSAQVSRSSRELLECALAVASWVCGREIEVDEQIILRLAEQALTQAGGSAGAVVTVPVALEQAAQTWAARLGSSAPQIVADPHLAPGTAGLRRGDASATVSVASALARAAASLGLDAPTCRTCTDASQ
jgi:hypothetical protein